MASHNYRYMYKAGKKLKTGYTTGSCAAAAAKAAALAIKSQVIPREIDIDTPKGWPLKLDIPECILAENKAACCVIKDAGDDPDVTDGLAIWAEVSLRSDSKIYIRGGQGVGQVTEPGLQISPGNAAINPVPLKMIETALKEILFEEGADVIISVPEGEKTALRTFNPKLGIKGGISILGTSGIVEPMSEDALKETIAVELKVLRKKGEKKVVLVPGNYGENFCQEHLKLKPENMVKMSNYLGFALEKSVELGFEKIIVAGHIGKMIKVAGGIFYTHSRVSDTRMEILTALLALMKMPHEDLEKIMLSLTTEKALEIIDAGGYDAVYQMIADRCAEKCYNYVFQNCQIETVIFSMTKMLAISAKGRKMLEEFENE